MPGLRPKSTAPCKDGSKDEGMNFHGQTDTKHTAGHLNLRALSPGRTDANPAHFPTRDSDLMPLRASGRGLNRKGCIVPFPSINANLNDCIDRKSTQAHQHSTHFPNPARTSFLHPISLSFWLACRVPTGRVGAVDDVPGLSVITLRDSNVNIKLQTPRQIDSRVKVLSTCPGHTSSSRSRCTTLMSAFESLRGRYLSLGRFRSSGGYSAAQTDPEAERQGYYILRHSGRHWRRRRNRPGSFRGRQSRRRRRLRRRGWGRPWRGWRRGRRRRW